MSTCVCVLSNSGERLMPTIRLGKVRRLLKYRWGVLLHNYEIDKSADSYDIYEYPVNWQ